jgi:hypothetical protein
MRNSSSAKLGSGFETLEPREMPNTTTLADAFGTNSVASPWNISTQQGDNEIPLSNYHPDLFTTGNTDLRGAEGAGRLDTVTVNPSYHLDVINGGTTLRIAYNDFQPNSPYRLWWDNGGRPESIALSGSGVVTYTMPWRENLSTGSLSITNGGIDNPITVPTSVQFRQGTVRHMFWTNGGGNGSVLSGDRSFPQAGYNTQREIRNTALLAGANTGRSEIQTPISIPWKPGEVIVRPGYNQPVKLQWRSPEVGLVTLRTVFKDVEPLVGDGVTYTLGHTKAEFQTYPPGFVGPKELKTRTKILDEGLIRNGELKDVAFGGKQILVNEGDTLFIILSPSGTQNDLSKSDGDATDIDLSIKLDPFPKNLYRNEGDLLESEAVIPKVQMWSTGTQITMKYDDIPDMGVDVRLGTVMNQHLPEGSGIVTYDLPNMFNGDPQAQGNLRVERSDTHVSIIKTLQIDMAGGYGTALRAMTPPTEAIPLLSLAWSRLIVTTPVQIQAGLRGELQALLDGRPSIRETPNLASMSKLSLLDRIVMTQTMPGLGGQSTLTVWKGPHAPGNSMETMSASAWNQMYSRLKALQLNPAPSLVQQLQLPSGPILFRPQMPAYQKVFAFPGIGNVTVISDPGHTPPGYQYPVFEHGMGVTNGVLSTMDIGFPPNAPVTMNRIGRENLQFVLPGTTYVRSIAVEYIGGEHMGGLSYTRADGTTKSLTLTSSGEIPVNDAITGFTIAPGERGAWGVKGISVAPVKTQRAVTPSQIWQVTGSALSLDVSQSQTLVSRVSGRVTSERPNDGVTVYAMRGQRQVDVRNLGADGSFVFEDTKGITGILVTHNDTGGNVAVSDVSIEGNRGALPLNMEAISPKTSGILCDVIKPEFDTGVSWNMNAALQQYNFCNPGVITSANPISVLRLVGNDTNNYSFHRILGTNGGTIDQVLALTEKGLIELPQQLYMRLGPNAIVTFKGCPPHLAFRMRFSGTVTEVGAARTGDKCEDVLPPEALTPNAQILELTSQPVSVPGFGDPILEIRSSANAHLMPGWSVGVRAQITNQGLGNGPVTVKVYCGYFGDERDPLQGTFTTDFASMQVRSLSCTVGAPPAAMDMRPSITIVCETTEGQVRTGWTAPIYHSDEYRIWNAATQKFEYVIPQPSGPEAERKMRTEYRNLAAARSHNAPDLAVIEERARVATADWRTAISRDIAKMQASLQPPPAYVALGQPVPTTEDRNTMGQSIMRQPLTPTEVGGATPQAYTGIDIRAFTDRLNFDAVSWNRTRDWFNMPNQLQGLAGLNGLQVDTRSEVGQLFIGILKATQGSLNDSAAMGQRTYEFLEMMQLPLDKLIKALTGTTYGTNVAGDVNERRVRELMELFVKAQLGHIFVSGAVPSDALSGPAHLESDKYLNHTPGDFNVDVYHTFFFNGQAPDQYVKLRFDLPGAMTLNVDHMMAYLYTGDGITQIGEALSIHKTGNMSFWIPLSEITKQMTPDHIMDVNRGVFSSGSNSIGNTFKIKIAVWPASGAAIGKVQEQKIGVEINLNTLGMQDLSLNPDPLKHLEENIMLNQLMKHFPVSGAGWRNVLGSGHHLGDSVFAADINFGSENDDQGKPVYAVASGVVYVNKIEDGNSVLILKHTMQVNGQTKFWYSKYLHIQPIGYRNGDVNLLTPWQVGRR